MDEPVTQSEAAMPVMLPTDVRYGTRSLLVAMTAISISIVAVSAFVRGFPEHAQPKVVVHWCIYFVLLALAVGFVAWRRYVIEREAGAVRYLLATHSYFVPKVPAIGRTLLGVFLLLAGAGMWGMESILLANGNRPFWLQFLSWNTYISIAVSTVGITYLWWYRSVRLCDEGIVVRHELVLWNACQRWYWDACSREVLVIEGGRRVALKVPDADREAVAALVERHVSGSAHVRTA